MMADEKNETGSVTGSQLDEDSDSSAKDSPPLDGEQLVEMTQAELDKIIANAQTDAVTKDRKARHAHDGNPPHIVTTQDISEREKAQDEKRGKGKLPDKPRAKKSKKK